MIVEIRTLKLEGGSEIEVVRLHNEDVATVIWRNYGGNIWLNPQRPFGK